MRCETTFECRGCGRYVDGYSDGTIICGSGWGPATAATAGSAGSAAYWSNRFGKPVSYVEKNVPLLVLNSKDKCVEVLAGDLKGWIIYRDWLKIREIEHA